MADLIKKNRHYLFSVAIVFLVSGLCFIFSDFIGYRVVALILLLTVSIIAVTFDIFPVLIAAALSAFMWDFFFIPPRFTIHVNTTDDTILLIMYFLIAMINAGLTFKIRQMEKLAGQREEKANSVNLYNTILDSLSHELRTPLATIIAATDNLQSNKNLTQNDTDQLITEISKASIRLNQQVENLLNLSRLESGHIKPKSDWCDIEEAIHLVVQRVEENNSFRPIAISISDNLALCNLDKGMLDQILYNLLNNAIIHTHPECKIEISATCYADILEIIIEDDGNGFSEREMKDIFNKFSRSKNTKTGKHGLGLSIVKGFTEALGGTVELNRGNGGGAKFTISLPVKKSYSKELHES